MPAFPSLRHVFLSKARPGKWHGKRENQGESVCDLIIVRMNNLARILSVPANERHCVVTYEGEGLRATTNEKLYRGVSRRGY